jgi:type VI secretion system secreted protein Hcp
MATVDCFLKLDGIEGESTDAKHKGLLDIESWSWGESQSGSHSAGGGGGVGKVEMEDLHIVTKVSKASPKLMLACATGEHIKKATLICRKAGKDQQEYFKIELSELLVSSYRTGNGGLTPTDQFSLNFAKIEFEYKPQNGDGSLGNAVKAGYDLKATKKV